MLFVKSKDLKVGMRLARPIYNKNGVLLYERNSKLTTQGINSIANFGLIGIFVLEPAEPVPPMTRDDIEFERFQTMAVFAIQEELQKMIKTRKTSKIQVIVANIIRNYGHLDKKINFIQSLRSYEDHVYKHALNVAILCTLMTHVMNIKLEEQLDTILAALVHDIGKVLIPKTSGDNDSVVYVDRDTERRFELAGLELVEEAMASNAGVKRICVQTFRGMEYYRAQKALDSKMVTGAKILLVAEFFDTMTAMQYEREPASEVKAIRELLEHPECFDPKVVDALIKSINILSPGVCIELNTGEKGLVIAPNPVNILRPVILGFNDNNVIDLGNEFVYGDLQIVDIMKTMDNRYIMDTSFLKKQGIKVDEPEYEEVPGEEEEYIPGRDF